jgi:hypothetical protein
VRCEHNCILAGPVSSRVRTHSIEDFRCFQEQKFSHPRQRQGANISGSSQSTVEQGANISRKVRRLQWSRVRTSQATHRQGANSLQAALRRGANLPGQGESEGVVFFGWITFKFARVSWCDT